MLGELLPERPEERLTMVQALADELGLSIGEQYLKTLAKRSRRVADVVDRLRAIKVWQAKALE
tara:strand:- start:26163 stop:26351 length:189 start_codon:yes stop_codon:yes gene_type:complete